MAWPPPPLLSLCTTIFTSMSPSLALSRTSLIYRFSVGSSFALAASVSFVLNAGWSALGARAEGGRVNQRKRGIQRKRKKVWRLAVGNEQRSRCWVTETIWGLLSHNLLPGSKCDRYRRCRRRRLRFPQGGIQWPANQINQCSLASGASKFRMFVQHCQDTLAVKKTGKERNKWIRRCFCTTFLQNADWHWTRWRAERQQVRNHCVSYFFLFFHFLLNLSNLWSGKNKTILEKNAIGQAFFLRSFENR